jgi:hypothetical protein
MPELVRACGEGLGSLRLGLKDAYKSEIGHGVSLEIDLRKLHHHADGAIGVIYKQELFALGHFPPPEAESSRLVYVKNFQSSTPSEIKFHNTGRKLGRQARRAIQFARFCLGR